uniref:Mitochondrial import receptor subunit TOM6 homolog n=1 Tax=Serinus canaria TaxID=9135 RepID=A0A8C9KPS1_SERCA
MERAGRGCPGGGLECPGWGSGTAWTRMNLSKIFSKLSALGFCDCRNLLLNLGLFAAGVWVARNLTDIDLMAPQPVP